MNQKLSHPRTDNRLRLAPSPLNPNKKMVKRAVPTSTPYAAKGEKLSRYIQKIVKKLSDERTAGDENSKRGFTLSKQAATEMELLIEHAINNVTYNAGAILKYSGAGTVTTKTLALATSTAFHGVLRDMVTAAGSLALDKYEAAVDGTAAA